MAIGTNPEELEAAVQQFSDGFLDGLEQTQDLLTPYVTMDVVEGDRKFYDRMGPVAVREKSQRRQLIEFSEPETERRAISWRPFYLALPIEEDDVLRTLKDPQGKFLQRSLAAFSRKKMQLVVDALRGPANGGEDGTTVFTLPGGNILASGGSPFNKDFIFGMSERFFNNHLGPQFGNGPKAWAISTQQARDFLNIAEFTQREYASVQRIETEPYAPFQWHGWTFIPLPDGTGGDDAGMGWDGLGIDGSDDRDTFAFTKDSVNMIVKREVSAVLQPRPDYVGLQQLVVQGKFDASRMRESSVYVQLSRES